MQQPLTSGAVADRLGITEPRLNDLIRRGKIDPAPPVVAGRRLWSREHVAQAAKALGCQPQSDISSAATNGMDA